MYLKKCLALLVSAALAVSLLAACGSRALSNVMADLLTGLYDNVSVEVDNDLTAALKKAVSAGGTQEEILAALVENLNLSGVSIAFSSLGSGQQGQHGVTLTFQTGNDPDAAARIALAQWASIFGSLPKNGSYSASVAMIEADNGYYIAVDVEVTRAGSTGKDEPDLDYTTSTVNDVTTYTVYTATGLQEWARAAQEAIDGNKTAVNCTLGDDINLTGKDWTPIGDYNNSYTGTFDGGGYSIKNLTVSSSGSYAGLIGCLGSGGTVQNLTLENVNLTGTFWVGGVVGHNYYGTVSGCTVSGSVEGSNNVGGVVGFNSGTVTGCTVSGNVKGTGDSVGGVVGYNNVNSTVTACYSTGAVTATGSNSRAGGVVGYNIGTVTACYSTGDVTVTSTSGYAGGVVGYNGTNSTVTACYSTGDVTATGTYVGGVAGRNYGTVTACYWSDYAGNGIGSGSGGTTQVDGNTVKWTEKVDNTPSAMDAMNEALKGEGWRYISGDDGLPTLTGN